ncbi:uncharacterized protein LOC124971457 [Sciurus carolinensis]|uniref:uncharacterized protein LOC124971457 n=1 Tax=Sciurus carolinensis TaxID=30640 RepID=UPI001FB4439D|nr:uncharacterized protein LOC124971457 [Sciurus carolinensis]
MVRPELASPSRNRWPPVTPRRFPRAPPVTSPPLPRVSSHGLGKHRRVPDPRSRGREGPRRCAARTAVSTPPLRGAEKGRAGRDPLPGRPAEKSCCPFPTRTAAAAANPGPRSSPRRPCPLTHARPADSAFPHAATLASGGRLFSVVLTLSFQAPRCVPRAEASRRRTGERTVGPAPEKERARPISSVSEWRVDSLRVAYFSFSSRGPAFGSGEIGLKLPVGIIKQRGVIGLESVFNR